MKDVRKELENIIEEIFISWAGEDAVIEKGDYDEDIKENVDQILALFNNQQPKQDKSDKIELLELMSNSDKPDFEIMWDKINEIINKLNNG